MRTGGLLVPEALAQLCPWCAAAGRRVERLDTLPCPRCGDELRCSGWGNVHSRDGHALSCWEVACDLRYLPIGFDWRRVLKVYELTGESVSGRDREPRQTYRPRVIHR